MIATANLSRLASVLLALSLAVTLTACGDDAAEDASASNNTATSTNSGTTSSTNNTQTSTNNGGTSTNNATTSTNNASTGTNNATTTPPDDVNFAVVVRGTLFTDDLDEAQAFHDTLAAGGEEAAKSLGDTDHDVLLGTDLLGSPVDQFLAIDQWDNAEGMSTFYGDPAFAENFGQLFAGPPTLETFAQTDWAGWGDLRSGDNEDTYYFVVVRGTLAEDPSDAQATHDAVARGGEDAAKAAGDVAHVTFLGLEDPRQFLGIDVWTAADNIEAFYSNPDFQAAFSTLFSAPPTVHVYRSTTWHQW